MAWFKKKKELETDEIKIFPEPPVIRPITIKTTYVNKSLLEKQPKKVNTNKKSKPVVVKVDNFNYFKFVYDSLLLMKKQVYSELVPIVKIKESRKEQKPSPFAFTFSFNYVMPSFAYDFSSVINIASTTCRSTNQIAKSLKGTYLVSAFSIKAN